MPIAIKPLSEEIGAEVTGLDLREEIPGPLLAELKDLIDHRHLLYFPAQGLNAEEQVRFTSQFGPATSDGAGDQLHAFISNRRRDSGVHADAALLWHSDNGWSPAPTHFIALSGHTVTGQLAPTSFASSVRAAKVLPQALRTKISELRTINLADLAPAPSGEIEPARVPVPEVRQVLVDLPDDDYYYPRWTYPMIWRHPRTGAELLPVYETFSVCIEGMTPQESEKIYQDVFKILYDPEYVYNHHWRAGDVVIWDNIALQHGRPSFDGVIEERTLLRTTINPAKQEYLQHARRVADFGKLLQLSDTSAA